MSYGLDRVEGPPCPKCECKDALVHTAGTRWGQKMLRLICGHCGMKWSVVLPSAKRTDQPASTDDRRRQWLEWKSAQRNQDAVRS